MKAFSVITSLLFLMSGIVSVSYAEEHFLRYGIGDNGSETVKLKQSGSDNGFLNQSAKKFTNSLLQASSNEIGGYGFGSVPLTKADNQEYTFVVAAGYDVFNPYLLVYSAPESKCYGTHHDVLYEPSNGMLMYTSGIHQVRLDSASIPFMYIAHITEGNSTITPNPYTESDPSWGIVIDQVGLVKYSYLRPYETNNVHVYRNDVRDPNAPASYVNDTTEYSVSELGCFLVVDMNLNPVLREPHVWLTLQQSYDNGKDLFFASGLRYNLFNSSS